MNHCIFPIILLLTGTLAGKAQNFTEILGRPENTSVTLNVLFDQAIQVYWEYGESSGNYTGTTQPFTVAGNVPVQTSLEGLKPNSRYFYRTRYRASGSTEAFQSGNEHSFHTARPPGSVFTFAIEADPHMDTNSRPDAYFLTLQNILGKQPDFMFDLGDIFMSEKLASKTQANITERHLLYRPLLGSVCHSVPLYLVLGNHEGESGWNGAGSDGSLAVMAANTRMRYYPNPLPGRFYSGDTIAEPYVGLRGNYYAWEWGDALFVVLDPYWYTTDSPHLAWSWTLGTHQYQWFSKVIHSSNATFKFIFCHQLVGGNGNDGRGGSEYAMYYENGGLNSDSTRGFESHRPGWDLTLHELMKENRNCIYFHGHDHCYARQPYDGMIYQEVPQPSSANITNITGIKYGYKDGVLLPARGFLLVTVSDSAAKIEYLRSFLPEEERNGHRNLEVADSYVIRPGISAIPDPANVALPALPEQNYPNPFEDFTTVKYRLGEPGIATIRIFDIYGRETAGYVSGLQAAGEYSVSLGPQAFPRGGLYVCRFASGACSKTIKMICNKKP